MKFIHAADIHIDSPLHGLSAYPDAPVGLLRSATRDAFSALVAAAIEEQVDFLIIAGDLYDGSWRDHNTGIFFCKEMGRLKRAGIPAYVLFGNHDAESEMTRRLELPDNVYTFPSRVAKAFKLEHLKVALHGQSFKEKEVTTNLVPDYPAPDPGYFNIGVLHTALEGNAAHANYAPCTIAELHAKGYHYWALGHVHEHAVWHGASTIVFPGNLQGRNIRETGRRGAVLVCVDDDRNVRVERLFVDVLRWEAVSVDASGCATLAEVARAIGMALEALVADSPNAAPIVVRVTICGKSAAHGELFGLELQLRAEVLAQVAAIGNERLWLEKVRLETRPMADRASVAARADAIADLQDLLEEAETDPEFLQSLHDDLSAIMSKAPLEMQAMVPAFAAVRAGQLPELVRQVRPGLLAHLMAAQ